ncbi:hypothetical protein [Pedobacter soli]|uniref:ADP-heptose:LPS heptosyltransferase n=1 Tax=Pedobacter soli TaxID=390242 RepID=A0A1G6UDZ4_9SPHI|nr:hypothetical protein [Pedobacter soli]SDD39622.1 hypothetical protein SAMN04488024_105323 [Pedobacter soli]
MGKEFKKLNKIAGLYLKLTDKPKYIVYKHKLKEYKTNKKRQDKINLFTAENNFLNPDQIIALAKQNGELNIVHSGNAGDIIYALPTIKAITKLISEPVNLYLLIDQPHNLHPLYTHPLGNVTLNKKMAEMLIPLILEQDYINGCSIYQNEEIHLKLDLFRKLPIWLDKGNIIKWYAYTTGVVPTVNEPWIRVIANQKFSKEIVLARSTRYRNPHISYDFLKQYPNITFLGVESEFQDMQKELPHIKFQPVNDFKQMAQVIAGSAFFIGNQSFPYSIAEALKIPRILETSFETPNVIPDGENGHDFYLQAHFEWTVKKLVENLV